MGGVALAQTAPAPAILPPAAAPAAAGAAPGAAFEDFRSFDGGDSASCLPEIAEAERRYDIPSGLLFAIGLAESGRRDPDSGTTAPWPWSVNALATSHFFPSELEAEHNATSLLNAAVARIDVGCMQVDLEQHPNAFLTLASAFDPATNVDYAARLLRQLAGRSHSWVQAAADYHSADPEQGAKYLARVLYYWRILGLAPPAAQTAAPAAKSGGAAPPFRGFVITVEPDPLDVAADFFGQQDYATAITLYRAILESRPSDRAGLLGMSEALRATRQYRQAVPYLARLLALAPDDPAIVGLVLANADDLPVGERLGNLKAAQAIAPHAPEIAARIALTEEAAGDMMGAIDEMRQATAFAPRDTALLLDYAALLDRHGERAAAIAAYRAFLAAYAPGGPPLSVSLAEVQKRLSYLQASTQ